MGRPPRYDDGCPSSGGVGGTCREGVGGSFCVASWTKCRKDLKTRSSTTLDKGRDSSPVVHGEAESVRAASCLTRRLLIPVKESRFKVVFMWEDSSSSSPSPSPPVAPSRAERKIMSPDGEDEESGCPPTLDCPPPGSCLTTEDGEELLERGCVTTDWTSQGYPPLREEGLSVSPSSTK